MLIGIIARVFNIFHRLLLWTIIIITFSTILPLGEQVICKITCVVDIFQLVKKCETCCIRICVYVKDRKNCFLNVSLYLFVSY